MNLFKLVKREKKRKKNKINRLENTHEKKKLLNENEIS